MEGVMVATIFVSESVPGQYPAAPAGLSTEAAALDPALVWQRLEAYVAWRFSERTVEWIAEGCGDWQPPLKPATIVTTEIWNGTAWEAVTLSASPLGGYCLPGTGPYRFVGTVGVDGADVPAAVLEAYRRLAEYMAQVSFEYIGARSVNVVDVGSTELGSPSWRARALQDSGAADLLRTFRRA
jgi:hypothetical protein